MKLITDKNFANISTITASSTKPGFDIDFLKEVDPGLIWRPNEFTAAGVSLVLDLGSPQKIDYIWLNNANFLQAAIQANNTNAWTSPAVDIDVTLDTNKVEVTRGFFNFSSTPYLFVRLDIPYQSLINDTLPKLGNIILGDCQELIVAEYNAEPIREFHRFKPDGAGPRKKAKGPGRFKISLKFEGTIAELKAIPFIFEHAVLFPDTGDVSESFLIQPPDNAPGKFNTLIDGSETHTYEELA